MNKSNIKGCLDYTMEDDANMKHEPRKLTQKELDAFHKFEKIPFAKCQICGERDIAKILTGDEHGLFKHLCFYCREYVNEHPETYRSADDDE